MSGLTTEDPPQQPMPPDENANDARIGLHVGVPVADGVADVHGEPLNERVVNGQAIVNVIECPHITASPVHDEKTESHTRGTEIVGQSGHVVVTSA